MILNFAQGAGAYVAYGLSTDTKPASRTTGSLFIETDTDNTYISDGVDWLLPVNKKTIKALGDFPAPSAGVITLEDNTAYQISGSVDVSTNRFVVGVKNTIFGTDRSNDILMSSTTGSMFTMDNTTPKGNLIFDNLTLQATAGALLNVSGGTTDQVTFITTTISNTVSGGTISGVGFSIRTSSISSAFSSTGFEFTGTNLSFVLRDSTVANNAGIAFDLSGATFTSSVLISRAFVVANASQTFLDATSTTVTIAGQVALSVFSGAGTYFTGVTGETASWLFSNNQGVTNTLIPNSALANTAVASLSGANTGDNATNSQYSGLAADIALKAPLASPTFTGTVTLPNDTIALAKIQNIGTGKVLGRSTAASGDIEELTLGANMTLIAGVLNSIGVGGGGVWSSITGTLSNQTDLQSVLDMKQNSVLGVSSTEIGYLDGVTSSVVSINNTQVLSNKTLVTPSVASFAQAQHTHQNGAGGGQLAGSSIFTMVGGQIQTSVLGTGTASSTTFLRGDSTWATPSGGSDPFVAKLILGSSVRTGSTTPVDLTGMSFAYDTNSKYAIDIYARVNPIAATTGCGFGIRATTVVPQIAITTLHQLANTGTLSGGNARASDSIIGVSSGFPTAAVYNPVYGGGMLMTGSVAGTAQFIFRSEVAGGSVVCGEGTMIRAHKF